MFRLWLNSQLNRCIDYFSRIAREINRHGRLWTALSSSSFSFLSSLNLVYFQCQGKNTAHARTYARAHQSWALGTVHYFTDFSVGCISRSSKNLLHQLLTIKDHTLWLFGVFISSRFSCSFQMLWGIHLFVSVSGSRTLLIPSTMAEHSSERGKCAWSTNFDLRVL